MMKSCTYTRLGYVVFAIIFFLAGCGGGGGSDDGANSDADPSADADPSISSFSAADANITLGESTTLTGLFSNGTGNVSNGVGAVTSGVGDVVTPATTTTYILTVTNSSGVSVSSQVTVTIIVPEPNNAPVASGDAYVTTEGKLLDTEVAGLSGVLANDMDVDGDVLVAVLVSGPSHGKLQLAVDGSFAYQPDTGYAGPESFIYQADDGTDSSALATVNIEILDNPNPVVVPTLQITSPWDGATIASDTVRVDYVSSGDLTDVAQIHQRLDGGVASILTVLSGTTKLSGLIPGAHTVSLTLVHTDGTELTNPEAAAVVNFTTVVQNQPEVLDCSDPKSQPQIDDDFDSYNIGQNLDTQSPFWAYACEHFSNDGHSVVCDHGGTETGDNIIGNAACSDGITNGAGCSTYTAESYSSLKVCAKLDVVEVTNEYSALLIVDAAQGGDENDDGYYLDLRLPGRLALRTKPTDAFLAVNDSVNYGEGDMVCLAFWENAGTPTLTGTLNGAVVVEATDRLVFRGPFYPTVFISRDQRDLTLVNGFDDFGVAECGTNAY